MIIPEKLYQEICRVIPIPCVDLLVTDREGRVLLVKRKHEPAAGEWWFPGGRVHFGETRAAAAVRKLREECNLKATNIEDWGTYDIILDSSPNTSHGITTLFHMCVMGWETLKLDEQSDGADWHTPQEWQTESLPSFVSEGISIYLKHSM